MLLVLVLLLVGSLAAGDDLHATPEQLITENGYAVETYQIPTEDGFLLQTQRIPRPGRPAVYLQHGLLDSSVTWVLNRPSQSLGFILSDAGFDVWLGNSRGNRYSTLMRGGAAYRWNWTMDDLAQYDVKGVLDFITKATGKSKIGWMMFYGLSRFGDYFQKRLNVFVALAPVAWVGHARTMLLQEIADIDKGDIIDKLGYHDFLPYLDGGQLFCTLCRLCCEDFLAAAMGPGTTNATRFNQTRLPVYVDHFPAGTSSQEMAHYAQLVHTDSVLMYDFGSAKVNFQHYGMPTPPSYNLTNIPRQLPIALFTGGNDYLADPQDVLRLVSTLGPERFVSIIDTPDFNHADFVIGIDSCKVIYPAVVDLLRKYS